MFDSIQTNIRHNTHRPLSAERQSPNHGQRKRVDATNPALEPPMFCPASLDPAALSDDLDQG